jgi:hypothetical protein
MELLLELLETTCLSILKKRKISRKYLVLYLQVYPSSYPLIAVWPIRSPPLFSLFLYLNSTQTTDFYWSEESILSFTLEIRVIGTERRYQVRPICSIFEL